MLKNFLIDTINHNDMLKTKTTRLYNIKHPYDTNRKCVVAINHKPQWFITEHFKVRMRQRKISFFDVFKTIRFGECLYGKTNYERKTSCVFFHRQSKLIVVTTGNMEILITCFRSKDNKSLENKIKEYIENITRESKRDEKMKNKEKQKFKNKCVWKDKNDFENVLTFSV